MLELDDDDCDIAEASLIDPEWVIKGLLPVGLTVLGGPPKSGKSLIALAAAAIGAGWDCKALPKHLSHPAQCGTTQIITSEATPGELRLNLESGLRVKALSDFIKISDDPWRYFMAVKEVEPHKALIEKLSRIGLDPITGEETSLAPMIAILDPFIDFHDADEKEAGQIIKILRPLRDWAISNHSALILVHHTSKPPAAERKGWQFTSFDLRGSGAIFGKADAVLMVTPLKDNQISPVRIAATFKRSEGWSAEIDLAIWDSKLPYGLEKLGDIDKQVIKLYLEKQSLEQIAAKIGMTTSDIYMIISRLKKRLIV